MNQYDYFSLFHTISKDEYETFCSHLSHKSYKKKDFILREGQVQRELLFVRKGYQLSYHEHQDKIHVIAFTYPPGLCAVPESFLYQKPSTYNLKCVTDSEFEAISFESLNALFDQFPNIERLFRKITEAILIGMIQRHLDLHTLTIEQRFKSFTSRNPQLLHLLPHKYIASYLDIDRTNFSKLFNSVKI